MTRFTPHGGPKRLADCMPDNLRSALSKRLDEDSRLHHAWHSRVGEPLASHAHPVRYAAGLLFVHVDTAAWASRLRHEMPALVAALRANPVFRDLVNVRFRVLPKAPAVAASTRVPPKPTRLSAAAIKVISQTASTIADPGLRAALERLSQPARARRIPKHRP